MDNEKTCSLCGKPLSKYGNRKIKDGVLCRNCIKAASPWLTEEAYEKLSLDDYRKHLEYRELNKEKLKAFEAAKSIAGKYSLYLDEKNQQFLISKRKDYKKENADVMSLDDIREITIYEERYLDGNDVDICFDMKLKNDQIGDVCFRVNEFPGLIRDSEEHKAALDLALSYLDAFENEDGLDFEQAEGESDE